MTAFPQELESLRHSVQTTIIIYPHKDVGGLTTRAIQAVFNTWWAGTEIAQCISRKERKYKHEPQWHKELYKEPWVQYDLGAKATDGLPMLVCKRCSKAVVHPGPKGQGSRGPQDHLSSAACRGVMGSDADEGPSGVKRVCTA